jgi:hypothetical protein
MVSLVRFEQFLVVAALGVLAAQGGVWLASRARFPRLQPRMVSRGPAFLAGLLVLGVGVLVVRLLAPPALIHAGFHGYSLLDAIQAFPHPSNVRATYGQGSFLVLGLASKLLGGGWQATVWSNEIAGAALVLACAGLAARLGGRFAALATLALGLLSPLLVRTASSEDAHNLATLFGVLALLAADRVRTDRDWRLARLVLPVSLVLLAAHSRQTLLLHPLMVLLLLWPEERAPHAVAVRIGAAAGVLALGLASRLVLTSAQGSGDALSLKMDAGALWLVLTQPAAWLHNPLFRPDESLALLVTLPIGIAAVARRRQRMGWVLLGGALIHFWTVFPMVVAPGAGVHYALRLPLWSMLLPLGGLGAEHAWRFLSGNQGRRWRRLAAGALVLLAVGLAPLAGLARLLHERDPKLQELRLISEHARDLPADAVLLFPRLDADGQTNYTIPRSAFADAPCRVATLGDPGLPPGPRYLFKGLGCETWAVLELLGADLRGLARRVAALPRNQLGLLLEHAWHDPDAAIRMLGGRVPSEPRPECRGLVPEGARFIRWGTVQVDEQELPQIYYISRAIEVGVWQLDGTQGAMP